MGICLYNSGNWLGWGLVTTLWGGMGREMRGGSERVGTYAYLWLIHADVWQKPTQVCKTIILQLKNKYI